MAHTAHKTKEAMEEVEWDPERTDAAAKQVAELIKQSKHIVFFTGAGISTSAGIPDFRGPEGAWTLAAQHKQRTSHTVSMSAAMATPTHMSLVELYRRGKLQCLISQNVDGLHRKSGIPATHMAELHGNTTLEECDTCGKLVARDFQVHGADRHYTGRSCVAEGCNGQLRDIIINFGEDLPSTELNNGFLHSEQADLHICLGSSLTVSPACDMPMSTKRNGGKVVICNLQRTPLDKDADIRVHARTDLFMECIMRHLSFTPLPPFLLSYRVAVWRKSASELAVSAVLDDGTPHSLFQEVNFRGEKSEYRRGINPHVFTLSEELVNQNLDESVVKLAFFGHYHEPTVEIRPPQSTTVGASSGYLLSFNPLDGTFDIKRDDSTVQPPSYTPGATKKPSRVSLPPKVSSTVSNQLNDGTGIDYSDWFAVTPLKHCPHCPQVEFREGVTLDPGAACESCGNVGENMQCLTCFEVHCGRHVNQHMMSHNEATNHPMVVGFADLSIWCYECDAYLDPSNTHLSLIYRLLHNAKFGFQPGSGGSGADQQPTASRQPNSGAPKQPTPTPSTADSKLNDGTGIDYSDWFAVTPLKHCPHCPQVEFREGVTLDPGAACETCGNVGENMQCLTCFEVHCGRHVNQHMMSHNEATNHPMVVGFADLSFWCYECGAYLDPSNTHLSLIYRLLHSAKFGFQPGSSGGGGGDDAPQATAKPSDELEQGSCPAIVPECLHCRRILPPASLPPTVSPSSPCATCGIVGDVMLCLQCHQVHCGRHEKGHMLAHHDETGHAVVMSLQDRACWCYMCDSYIADTQSAVSQYRTALRK